MWPSQVGRAYRLLGDGWVREVLVMVLFTFSLLSAAEIGFRWDLWLWVGLVLAWHSA